MCKNHYKIGYVVCDWRWNILSFFFESMYSISYKKWDTFALFRDQTTPPSHWISSTHLIAKNPLGGKAFSRCLLFSLWWTINNQHSCLEIVMCDAPLKANASGCANVYQFCISGSEKHCNFKWFWSPLVFVWISHWSTKDAQLSAIIFQFSMCIYFKNVSERVLLI